MEQRSDQSRTFTPPVPEIVRSHSRQLEKLLEEGERGPGHTLCDLRFAGADRDDGQPDNASARDVDVQLGVHARTGALPPVRRARLLEGDPMVADRDPPLPVTHPDV